MEKPRRKKSVAYNIRMDEEMARALAEEAGERGESASLVIREAVREYLARKRTRPTTRVELLRRLLRLSEMPRPGSARSAC